MALKIIGTQIISLFQFKKGNPIKWKDFQKHLQSLEITDYGEGEAITREGAHHPILGAIHKDGQILYSPKMSQIRIDSDDIAKLPKLTIEIDAILKEIFKSPERLKSNMRFYEIEVKQELEPQNASALEILQTITPPNLFKQFENSLQVGKLNLFQYRFYYTSSTVDESIRKTVPWYDLQFFPVIENPDRIFLEIVCRDTDLRVIIKRCKSLYGTFLKYVEEKEGMVSR